MVEDAMEGRHTTCVSGSAISCTMKVHNRL